MLLRLGRKLKLKVYKMTNYTPPEQLAGKKVTATITSCNTIEQLDVARKLADNFHNIYGKRGIFDGLLNVKFKTLCRQQSS